MSTAVLGTKQVLDAGAMDVKLGLISHEEVFDVLDLDACVLFVPSGLPLGLPILRRHWKQRPGGRYDLTLAYEGHLTPDDANDEDFSLDAADQLDPIEMHKDILDLIAQFNGQPRDDGKVYFPPERPIIPGVDASSNAERNPLFGLSDYHNPGYVWTWTFVSKTIPGSILARLGRIDIPEARPARYPPQLSGNRNWLCIRGKADWKSNVWKISLSWLLSGPGGWSADVYRRPA